MHKFIRNLFLILSPLAVCRAEITEVSNMQKASSYFEQANKETLVVFDIDMVLIQPSDPAFQMPTMKKFHPVAKRVMKELSEENLMFFLTLMCTNSPAILVESSTLNILNNLKAKNVPTIALTGNLTGPFEHIPSMEAWKTNCLSELGIDFTQTAPSQNPLVLDDIAPYHGAHPIYFRGVLFANGLHTSKGDVLVSFLKKTKLCPATVIFIDDRKNNLEDVEKTLQKFNPSIKYQGLHYLGAETTPTPAISEQEFTTRWETLANKAKQVK